MFSWSDKMRVPTRFASIIVLLLAALTLPWAAGTASAEQVDANISFKWAFGVMKAAQEEPKVEPITGDMTLKTGDHFKMLVEPEKKCFVYVVYHNAQDEVVMLFPYSIDQLAGGYEISKRYYVPQSDAWFELDSHTGRETFYLLASVDRLTELENLLKWYASADPGKKPDITRQILAEIRNVKMEHREFASAAERPVPIGGAIRGIERAQGAIRSDIDNLAEEITATDFYAKTFTIEHQ